MEGVLSGQKSSAENGGRTGSGTWEGRSAEWGAGGFRLWEGGVEGQAENISTELKYTWSYRQGEQAST